MIFDQNVLPAVHCAENGDAASERINGKCFRAVSPHSGFGNELENVCTLIRMPEDSRVAGTRACKKSDPTTTGRSQVSPEW